MLVKRTDLALEARELWQESTEKTTRLSGVKAGKSREEGYPVTRVDILDQRGEKALGKPQGSYLTIDLTTFWQRKSDFFERAVRAVGSQLRELLPEEGPVLVIGLGNEAMTPDAVGPLAADNVLITRHLIAAMPKHFAGFRPVAVFRTGVLGTTGVESAEAVRGLVAEVQPALVIAVDALASRRVGRVCATVQLSDTGIIPGSGVGNHRAALNRETLGVPVLAVGIPTVVDAATGQVDQCLELLDWPDPTDPEEWVGLTVADDGDLHAAVVPVRSGDELEVLTRTLDTTVESVNRYISDIQQVLTQVAGGNLQVEPQVDYKGDFALIRTSLDTIIQSMNETILGFEAAASRLAEMSEELNGQSGQLQHASMEQTKSTEELVQEVAHVKERLASVTNSSNQTRTKTGEIAQCIQEANTRMDALSEAMDGISANAQKITQIAKSIEDIAFQTGILAINASVEAARAGSAGKGFAVVAEEVRQLASRSSEAAQSAADTVNSTRAMIQAGVKLTADTAGSLQDISAVSSQIGGITDQLVAAVQGQESALAIMEERIGTIFSIAERNLQNATGTEQSSGLLAKEAEALRFQVQRFKVKEERGR